MAHKKKINQEKESMPYEIEDAMKITEDIFNLSKEKEYNPGAFVHGLIFALEATQQSYNIPQQQLLKPLNNPIIFLNNSLPILKEDVVDILRKFPTVEKSNDSYNIKYYFLKYDTIFD